MHTICTFTVHIHTSDKQSHTQIITYTFIHSYAQSYSYTHTHTHTHLYTVLHTYILILVSKPIRTDTHSLSNTYLLSCLKMNKP